MTTRCMFAAGLLALVLSVSTASQSFWISGKAVLAQHLLERAWQASLNSETPAKPWSWADVRTVAKLSVPAIDESLIVLSDASGEAMAFGPGLVAGKLHEASSSTIALGGHRDTHLAFLENAAIGDEFILDTDDGQSHRYQLINKSIVDTQSQALQLARDSPGLVLITCYPFNALQTGGPLRMVASAIAIH